jgi:hypothetical protein
MNNALVSGKKMARFFHLYQESFIADILLTYHQSQMAILGKEVRSRGVQDLAESNQVKKCDFNNNVKLPASGCVTIIRAPKVAFDI